MPYMFLIIKGCRAEAEAQARRRGIDLVVDGESDNHNEAYGFASMSNRPKIVDWYCEDRGIARLAQRGELLWYAERPD